MCVYHPTRLAVLVVVAGGQISDLVLADCGVPELKKFLDFWERELDGPLHSVRLAHAALIKPAEFSFRDIELTLH